MDKGLKAHSDQAQILENLPLGVVLLEKETLRTVHATRKALEILNQIPDITPDKIRGALDFRSFLRESLNTEISNLVASGEKLLINTGNSQVEISAFENDSQIQVHIESKRSEDSDSAEKIRRLEKLSNTDELTQIPNRRAFNQRIEEEASRSERYGHALSLLMLDLDNFKQVNDENGHETGDKVLQEFSQAVSDSLRGQDFVARYGGEEFVVVLPETPSDGAARTAERIRKLAETLEVGGIKFTVSIGVSTLKKDESPADFIKRADDAMYVAKEKGRNRVEVMEYLSDDMIGELEDLRKQKKLVDRRLEELFKYVNAVFVDLRGNIKDISPKIVELSGKPKEYFIGRKIWEFYENGIDDAKDIMQLIRENGKVERGDIDITVVGLADEPFKISLEASMIENNGRSETFGVFHPVEEE